MRRFLPILTFFTFICAWPHIHSVQAATPAFVQQKAATGGSSSATVTLDASPTIGNSLIAVISHIDTRTVSSVSGGGVTWTQSVHPTVSGAAVDIWYGHVSDGSSAVITVTMSGSFSRVSANVSEWSGLKNAAPESTNSNSALLDASPTTNSATPVSTRSVTIGAGAWTADDYSSGPTNSYTRLTQAGNTVVFQESAYLIKSSASSTSTGWGLTAGINWCAAIASFGSVPDGPTAAQAGAGFFMQGR